MPLSHRIDGETEGTEREGRREGGKVGEYIMVGEGGKSTQEGASLDEVIHRVSKSTDVRDNVLYILSIHPPVVFVCVCE